MDSSKQSPALTPASHADGAGLREVMRAYPSGVVILTAAGPEGPVGMAANSFVSVSLDPPLALFCAAKTSTTWPVIRTAGAFTANVLAEDGREVCRRFAASGIDRFEGVAYRAGRTGAPVLDCASAFLECVIEDVHEAGDHHIVVGAVVDLAVQSQRLPLVFAGGTYWRLEAADR